MKGCDIVVGGSVGHFSAFMAQTGTLVVCGDAGPNLGDSLYEATIYVLGKIHSLGADAREEDLQAADVERISHLLAAAEIDCDASQFKRIASARSPLPLERRRRGGLCETRHRPGYCHHCHTGQCPVGITTQDAVLERRLTPEVGARRLKNYLQVLNMELTTLARACGKSNVHHLEREDLVALTVEAAAMAEVPLVGTDWIPGSSLAAKVTYWE